ncbi:hypothetical protein V8G54_001573 [Vigna mungo]|uniref:Transmembrane protein n=1 Tax=Vigna mungo TaxID=3915 RepID=A0AAQ3SBY7_VIGMU
MWHIEGNDLGFDFTPFICGDTWQLNGVRVLMMTFPVARNCRFMARRNCRFIRFEPRFGCLKMMEDTNLVRETQLGFMVMAVWVCCFWLGWTNLNDAMWRLCDLDGSMILRNQWRLNKFNGGVIWDFTSFHGRGAISRIGVSS